MTCPGAIKLTILERDLPPYNRDDRIGSMTLKLKNTNGVLSRDWISGLSTRNEALKNAGDEVHSATKFYMDGSGGIYEMVLQVKLS